MKLRRSFLICLNIAVGVAGVGLSALMVRRAGGTGLMALAVLAGSASPFVLLMLTVARVRTVPGVGLLLAGALFALGVCFSVWFDGFYLRPSSLNGALLWQVPAVALPAIGLLIWRILRWERGCGAANKPIEATETR
jgi:hypothetical protein